MPEITPSKLKSFPQASSSYCVALTGGIASGKSTVSSFFSNLGVPVIDTDVIARNLVEPGAPALQRIADELGSHFIGPEYELDRPRLRKAIFQNPDIKSRLERILHPLILEEVKRQAQAIDSEYFLLVVPLLAESNNYEWVDRIAVVDISAEEQVSRLMKRDGVSRTDAENALKSQADRKARLKLADDVIPNHGSQEELMARVSQLHEQYLNQARVKKSRPVQNSG